MSVASQLIEEVTVHLQRDSLEDAREICADGTYFLNNLRIKERMLLTSLIFLILHIFNLPFFRNVSYLNILSLTTTQNINSEVYTYLHEGIGFVAEYLDLTSV